MMRSSSLPLHDLDELSSPDPLANSSTERLPVATRSPTRSPSPPKRRLSSPAKSSRTKKNFHRTSSRVSTYSSTSYPVSPSRTVTEQTLSPWKIRVTVEAEPEDGGPAGETMTRTIKIPLREESSPLGAEAIARRGRRSAPSSTKTKRSGTPVRRRSRSTSRTRRQSVTDLNVAPLGDDGDGDEWKLKRPSPRKKRQSTVDRVLTRAEERRWPGSKEASKDASIDSGRSKTPQSVPFGIHEDRNVEKESLSTTNEPSLSQSLSPELRQIDLNRVSVRQRSHSTKRKGFGSELSDQVPHSDVRSGVPAEKSRNVSATSAASYPTPSPTSSYHGSDEVEKAAEAAQEHENYDTIMESEGFTMIDLDTIPSARQYLTSPEEQNAKPEQTNTESLSSKEVITPQSKTTTQPLSMKKPTPIPSYLTFADDESELSSNVPSSPPAQDNSLLVVPGRASRLGDRKVTPQTYSSPSLPPPPPAQKTSQPNSRSATPPSDVLDAGLALQDAVVSDSSNEIISVDSDLSDVAQKDFFTGFSSGTKRELRAGLRFGEELAKRQKPISSSNKTASTNEQPTASHKDGVMNIKPQVSTQVWRGETTVQHSPFATESQAQTKKDESNRLSGSKMERGTLSNGKSAIPAVSSKPVSSNTQTPNTASSDQDIKKLNTTARREHEWQLEREAVSREIEDASPSKVVVIDSDDDAAMDAAATQGALERDTKHPAQRRAARKGGMQIGQAGRDLSTHLSTHGGRASEKNDQKGVVEKAVPRRRAIAETTTQAMAGRRDRAQEQTLISKTAFAAETQEEEDDDIWLLTARDSSSPRDQALTTQASADLFTHSEQHRQRQRAVDILAKPKRSLLPSPWKRGEDINPSDISYPDAASTFMSDGTSIFWTQPEEAVRFGAGEMKRQERRLQMQSSGKMDLETMLSSPVKLARAGRESLKLRKSDEYDEIIQTSTAGRFDGEEDQDEADEDEDRDERQAEEAEDETQADSEQENEAEGTTSDASEEETQLEPSDPSIIQLESSTASSAHSSAKHGQPQTVPVNFNDSTLSLTRAQSSSPSRSTRRSPRSSATAPLKAGTPPRQQMQPNERVHLTPPRSAMKGARLSFSPDKTARDLELRKVVFNDRTYGVTIDGDESSMSVCLDSPLVERTPSDQPPAGFREEHGLESEEREERDANEEREGDDKVEEQRNGKRQKKERRESWLQYLWRGKTDDSTCALDESSASISGYDGTNDDSGYAEAELDDGETIEVQAHELDEDDEGENDEEDGIDESDLWAPAKTALPSTNITEPPASRHTARSHGLQNPSSKSTHIAPHPQPHANNTTAQQPSRPSISPMTSSALPSPQPQPQPQRKASSSLPSYLQPPSYPSLPNRDVNIPMSTGGDFTNAHFRTLHIIHAKSQRPKFHPPKGVRSSVRKVVGWKLEVDHSDISTGKTHSSSSKATTDHGLADGKAEHNGESDAEASSLGMFEWTVGPREAEVLERFMQEVEYGHICAGIEGGADLDVGGKVVWGWKIKDLARHLGMIVVGTEVRREEAQK